MKLIYGTLILTLLVTSAQASETSLKRAILKSPAVQGALVQIKSRKSVCSGLTITIAADQTLFTGEATCAGHDGESEWTDSLTLSGTIYDFAGGVFKVQKIEFSSAD